MLNLLLGTPRKRAAQRTDATDAWAFNRTQTRANVVVDEDIALTYSAVWSATRLLTETSAALPLKLYRRTPDGREPAVEDPLYDLLHSKPNPMMEAMPFREVLMQHAVNWGNGFAEIERARFGDPESPPVALWPIQPSRVRSPRRHENYPDEWYIVRNNDNSEVVLRPFEILHIPGVLTDDGLWGKGVIQYARETIGGAIGAERQSSTFLGSGAQPKGIIFTPGMQDNEKRRRFRSEWKEVHGSGESAEVGVLPLEAKYQQVSMSSADAQFLESRKLSAVQIAQWYRVPVHMLPTESAPTKASVEQMGIEFVQYSLMPWLRRAEGQYNLKLLTESQRRTLYYEHLVDGLQRGDYQTRMNGHRVAVMSGLKSINDVAKEENLNGIGPDGDQRFFPTNMSTLENIINAPPPGTMGGPGSDQSGSPDPEGGDPEKANPVDDAGGRPREMDDAQAAAIGLAEGEPDGWRKAAQVVLADALRRMLTKESNAAKKESRNPEFTAWLTTFHDGHRSTLTEALRPAALCLNEVLPVLVEKVLAYSRDQLIEAYNAQTPTEFGRTLMGWPARAEALAEGVTNA